PGLPASCSALIRRALAKAPRDRHHSAQELLWDARHVLQDLHAVRSGAAIGASPRPPMPPSRPPGARRAGLEPAVPRPLATTFGFVRRPFADPGPGEATYLGEPFASARDQILKSIAPDAAPFTALVGEPGSGRAVLCRRIASEVAAVRTVWLVDGASGGQEGTLVQRLCLAAGVVEGATDDESLDAVVASATDDRPAQGGPPLLVLATDAAAPGLMPALARLISAALWTRSFQVLAVGAPGLVTALRSFGLELGEEDADQVELPSLERAQVAAYLRHWIRVAREPVAPPLIVSPDACLLMAWRSQGSLRRLDRLASDMLLRAAREGRRTLCSFDAWIASEESEKDRRDTASLPRAPEAWPTPEALKVIDACRLDAGLPPWPRADAEEPHDAT
ncbi:MAG TPA: hypothetical protein VF400_12450, partial [Anaeromyxobacteraceae bacterium]